MNTAKIRHWTDRLVELNACQSAVDWARAYPTEQAAWDACERGDWMLWLIPRAVGLKQGDATHRKLVLTACKCGRLSLPYAGKWREQLEAIYADLERWANGDNEVDLKAAWGAAGASARAAWATAEAAGAAAGAARAAWATAEAAGASARAAWAAAGAAWGAAGAGVFKKCAVIVRKHFPRMETPSTQKLIALATMIEEAVPSVKEMDEIRANICLEMKDRINKNIITSDMEIFQNVLAQRFLVIAQAAGGIKELFGKPGIQFMINIHRRN